MRSPRLYWFAAATLFVFLHASSPAMGDETYLTQLRTRRPLVTGTPSNLAPALIAVKDAGGVLEGSDETGRAMITVPKENDDAFKKSHAVLATTTDVPPPDMVRPVANLKLTYKEGEPPSAAMLEDLGLRAVEDYKRGSFLIVEPTSKRIDAALAARIQGNSQIQYATPLFQVDALPPAEKLAADNSPPENDPKDPPTQRSAVAGTLGPCQNPCAGCVEEST